MDNLTAADLLTERLTQREKEKDDFMWYKGHIDKIGATAFNRNTGFQQVSEYSRMKVNYDLFNNILNVKELEYVCKPYGSEMGELPATLTNRDIVSGKIKVLLGMEMKRPFKWKVMAVNEEATTRKEEVEFGKIQEFVVNSIMMPLKASIAKKYQEESQGKQLTPEQAKEVEEKIQQELAAQTPDRVRKYMKREHQDPAEALNHQLLEYLIKKERIPEKFNKGWKHSVLAGPAIFWVGVIRDEPALKVVNPLHFDWDRGPDIDRIQDGSWACARYYMNLSQICSVFDLTDEERRKLQTAYPEGTAYSDFSFTENIHDTAGTIEVRHYEWKSEKKIGFLSYQGKEGPQMMIVSDDYKLNKKNGDISVEWMWVPEKHEGYRIGSDIYKLMRPVPGQIFDMDNLYECPLSYIGAAHDDMNSAITAPMDRMKGYQYYYNIILYRIELLMASDKGKMLMMNLNAIPKTAGIDIAKWNYYADATKIMYVNPNEEGNRNSQDVTTLAKEIDMSLASDIQKYIGLAEYIEERCGNAVGIPKNMEGQIGPDEAVTNTRQNIVQNSYILEPYFELFNNIKREVLQQLLDVAKVVYSTKKPRKLAYMTDDMTYHMLTVDTEILANSTVGVFVSNSSRAFEAKQSIEALAQAGMQNQMIDLSAVIKTIRSEGVQEAEEILEAAEDKKRQDNMQMNTAQQQSQIQLERQKQEHQREEWDHEKEMIILKEEERRKTELQKQAMLSQGFDPNKDEDGDGEPDVLEIYKHGLDVEIKTRKQNLDEKKFEYDKEMDQKKLELERKKIESKKSPK